MFHAHFSDKDGESDICQIKWRTDARYSPNLTPEWTWNKSLLITIEGICNTNNNLTSKQNLSQALLSIMCCISHIRVFSHIGKPFFPYYGQFLKRLSDFKHSYLSQMTSRNLRQYFKLQVSSLVVKNISILKIRLLLCILCLIKQEYFSWVTR